MKRLIIGNLKMHLLSPIERDRYLDTLEKELKGKKFPNAEVVVCPPFVHLEAFKKRLGKKIHPVKSPTSRGAQQSNRVKLGAQNVFSENKGSFTGEVSPMMLKNLGCEYVILGHSERRKYFSETDEEVNRKSLGCLKNGLKPIICIGETGIEREMGETHKIITRQVKEALKNVSRTKAEELVLAYEPVWAVGSDNVPESNETLSAKLLIKKIITGMFGKKYAEKVRIIYGGSVSVKSTKETCVDPEMDGALIGRDSLVPYEFIKIVEIINN